MKILALVVLFVMVLAAISTSIDEKGTAEVIDNAPLPLETEGDFEVPLIDESDVPQGQRTRAQRRRERRQARRQAKGKREEPSISEPSTNNPDSVESVESDDL